MNQDRHHRSVTTGVREEMPPAVSASVTHLDPSLSPVDEAEGYRRFSSLWFMLGDIFPGSDTALFSSALLLMLDALEDRYGTLGRADAVFDFMFVL